MIFLNYIGEICPGCGKVLAAGDDIVVCPDCATPQHRECWNRTTGCVNGYLHASGYEWHPSGEGAPAEPDTNVGVVLCPACGAENSAESFHCGSCGAPLPTIKTNTEEYNAGRPVGDMFNPFAAGQSKIYDADLVMCGIDPSEEIGGESASNISAYLKRSQRRFIPRFRKIENGRKVSWNWAAFFFSPYYFFFRRLNIAALAFAGVALAISLVISPAVDKVFADTFNAMSIYEGTTDGSITQEEFMTTMQKDLQTATKNPVIIGCGAATLILHLIAALSADAIYYNHMKKDFRKVHALVESSEEIYMLNMRIGGTSVLNVFAGYCGINIITRILLYIADMIM